MIEGVGGQASKGEVIVREGRPYIYIYMGTSKYLVSYIGVVNLVFNDTERSPTSPFGGDKRGGWGEGSALLLPPLRSHLLQSAKPAWSVCKRVWW